MSEGAPCWPLEWIQVYFINQEAMSTYFTESRPKYMHTYLHPATPRLVLINES